VLPLYVLMGLLALRLAGAFGTEVHMRYYGNLYDAVNTGDAKVLQQRIDAGCDVNEKVGEDPLTVHIFIWYGYHSRYEPGPAKNVRDERITEMLKVLIANGANVDAVDKHRGWSALFWAVAQFNTEAVKLLVDGDADVNLRDQNGYSPLHFAQTPQIVRLLLDAGADVNARANDGNTPLHMAPPVDAQRLLISHGADVNAKNDAGETPLDVAVREGYEEMVELLKNNGGEPGG